MLTENRYFNDILHHTNKAVQSVIIYPDGTWVDEDTDTANPDAKLLNANNNNKNNNNNNTFSGAQARKISFRARKSEIILLDNDDEDSRAPTPTQSQTVSPSSVIPGSSLKVSRKRGPRQVSSDEEESTPMTRARPDTRQVKKSRMS